jgi:anti-sigma factor RsiW
MTCRELVEAIIDYLDGDLSQQMRCLVEEHLNRCPPCVHFFESYQITIKLTRQLPQEPMPSSLNERLNKLLEQIREFRDQGGENS